MPRKCRIGGKLTKHRTWENTVLLTMPCTYELSSNSSGTLWQFSILKLQQQELPHTSFTVCYFSAVFCGQDRTLSSVQTYAHATMGSLLWTHKSHWKPLSDIPEKAQVCMAKCEFCMSTSFKLQKPTCFFWYLLHMHVGVQRIFYGVYQPFCLPRVMYVEYVGHNRLIFFFSVGHALLIIVTNYM